MIPLDLAPNLIDQVYARILDAITDRTLLPGQRIRQNELAEKLGVSRQPVSHALHLLHRQGLVPESRRRDFGGSGQGRGSRSVSACADRWHTDGRTTEGYRRGGVERDLVRKAAH